MSEALTEFTARLRLGPDGRVRKALLIRILIFDMTDDFRVGSIQ